MRGIKLQHNVAFVEHDGVTVRINADGTCDLSPVLLSALEWELRTEPPKTWTYITDSDIDAFGKDTLQQIERIVAEFHEIIGT